MAALRSKIARLPFALRERINQRLHDGDEGQPILDWLNAQPEVETPVSHQNLSVWRNTGYQEWLKGKQAVETTKARAELCLRIAEAGGADIATGAAAVMGGRLLEVLEDSKAFDIYDEESLDRIKVVTDAVTKIQRNSIQLKRAKVAEDQTELRRQKAEIEERAMQLAELKFMLDSGKRLRELALSGEIQSIVGGTANADEQIDQLMRAMFGSEAVDRAKQQAANV